MGRRIKEEPEVHRGCIADVAELLFAERGIAATTMDDIAKTAKYSKATLYVYYKNKEEIVGVLVLRSMKMLYEHIKKAIAKHDDINMQYYAICTELVAYQKVYPFYFDLALGEINVDFDASKALAVEREIFEAGERLMAEIAGLLARGMEKKIFRADIKVPQTVFLFWASLSGVIVMAGKKKKYIEQTMAMTAQEFLDYSFEALISPFRV